MELKQLRYFVAVAEMGSFTRAAESLFVAQSALTRQIQALERELNLALFERSPRPLVLTYGGEVFLDRARTVLQEIERTHSTMLEIGNGATGNFRVAAGPGTMQRIVLPVVGEFRTQWPRLHVQLVEADYSSTMLLVEHGHADLAVGTLTRSFPNLHTELLCTSKVNALLSPGHRLASCESLRVQDLTQEHLLLIGASPVTRVARELMFHVYGVGTLSIFESNLPETILQAAEMGLGIALLADSFSHRGHALKAIPLLDGDNQVSFQIVVAWNRDKELPPGTKNFIQLLKVYGTQEQTD